ncbi:MAG: DUF3667 domain-containing protein [Psychroserpens sp.]|uniref:DUF3667 domain-containing protein n=1 Tax=Psychroserpens sp. TaxID=2020870 RepID=UPI003C72948F
MNCGNCNTQVTLEQQFCSQCGEKTTFKRLSLKSIVGSFFSDLISYDNKFLKTFKVLSIKPELVIESYIQGFRRTYVNPLTYLGLTITLIGFQFFILNRFFPELLRGDTFFATKPDNSSSPFDINSFLNTFYQYQGILTVLLIPLYGFASRLLFLDFKKHNLAEHFIINIYANSHLYIIWVALTLATLPLGINYNVFSQFSAILLIIYLTYIFKRLYNIKTYDALARIVLYTILVLVATIILVFVMTIIYILFMIFSGQLTPSQL